MPKRDRWDSSSEDEESKQEKSTIKVPKKATKTSTATTKTTTTTTTVEKAHNLHNSNQKQEPTKLQHPRFPLHNPLLQGCRSVYDTYERIARVSEGTYGIVWKAKDMATNEIVALKQIKFDDTFTTKVGFPVTALREINVLLALSQSRKW
jgi:cell division cycle 2-like